MVLYEENFGWAHQHKLEKYEDLQEQCVRNGWITSVLPIEVGCSSFIANSTFSFLTNLPARKVMHSSSADGKTRM